MIQRIETWEHGQLVAVEEIEVPDPPQEPLDPAGALATLLVVEGVLPLQDAANAVYQTPEALILEAEAWAAAEENP